MDPDMDPRIAAALDRLTELGVPPSEQTGLDAVVEGIDTLAALMARGRGAMEDQVRSRTGELERANRDTLRLIDLRNRLETSESFAEAQRVIAECLAEMFDGQDGWMYRYRAPHALGTLQLWWGEGAPHPVELETSGCWALRLRAPHVARAETPSLFCPHVAAGAGDSICVPMFTDGDIVGLLHLRGREGPEGARLNRATRHLAMLVCDQITLTSSNLLLRKRLQNEALRDPLTGLHNRRFVDDWVEREVSRSSRSGRPFGVIMLDVDHFKQTNDTHGHDAGDAVLTALGRTFRESLRQGDIPCRYGGEEFLILLPEIGLEALVGRADALRQQVNDLRIVFLGSVLPAVSVSAGVAVFPLHGATGAEVVQAADTAMYDAKRAGRNRVGAPDGAHAPADGAGSAHPFAAGLSAPQPVDDAG